MKRKMVAGLATGLFMFGMAGMANAAIVEGFEDSDTIFSYYSSSPSYDINNDESSHTDDYSFKVNPSGSTSGSAWGGAKLELAMTLSGIWIGGASLIMGVQ